MATMGEGRREGDATFAKGADYGRGSWQAGLSTTRSTLEVGGSFDGRRGSIKAAPSKTRLFRLMLLID